MAGLTGLASGLDSESLIAQLLRLRRSPITRMELAQKKVATRETALKDITTRLNNLNQAAKDLSSTTLWKDSQTVESSDPTKISARQLSPTGTGAYAVEVSQLARSAQRSFSFTSPTSASQLTLQSASGSPLTIDIAAGASIQEVADALNSNSESPVYAVAVGSDKLVFSSRASGAANGFDAADVAGVLTQDASKALAGQDAAYTVNGSSTVQYSASNIVTDAVPGVELTFKSTTPVGSPLVVTVSPPQADVEAAKAKVKAFVEQYNSTVEFIRTKLTEKKVPNATTETDARKGALFGDTALSGILSQLRIGVTQTFSGLGNAASRDQLAEIGVSTGAATGTAATADQLAGKLVLDEAKLVTALADGRFDVKRLLGGEGGVGGLAQTITGLVEPYTKSDGLIDGRIKSGQAEKTRLTDSITRAEMRLTSEETRLRAQFASLESTLSASRTQQSWLTSQLNSLY